MLRLTLVAVLLASASAHAGTAIVNVNVVPMTREVVLDAHTVIVEDGRIAVVGPVDTVPVPDGMLIIDGTDRYLIPGLGEMHAHVPAVGSANLDRVLTLFAVNGVTLIRGMLGQPSHLGLRAALAEQQRFGPRLVTSGPSLNGNSVSGKEDGQRQVEAQFAAGYDFIKIHPGLEEDEFVAITATAARLGMPVAGHVPSSVGVEAALAAGMASIDHLDGYLSAMLPPNSPGAGGYGGFFGVLLADLVDPSRIATLVDATAAAGTWTVPTQTLVEQRVDATPAAELAARSDMQYMPESTVSNWLAAKTDTISERDYDIDLVEKAIALRRSLIRNLHAQTGRLLLGSDAPQVFNVPGFSAHHELELYVESGLSAFEALAAGTTAVADFLGMNTGTIEPGRDADLVLLDDNPLNDIRNTRRVHGVMLQGTWYSNGDLEARRRVFRRPLR